MSLSTSLTRVLAAATATLGLLVSAPAQAACDRQFTPDELARFLSTADAAFADLDGDTFSAALVEARKAIPCLSAPLNSSVASAYHRAEAFQSFLDRDHAATVQHFRAMLDASPGYLLSEMIAPEAHPLRTDFEIAQGLPPDAERTLAAPTEGSLVIDGEPGNQAPTSLPFVFQHLDVEGKPTVSRFVEIGATLPEYGAVVESSRSTRRSGGGDSSARSRRLGPPLVAAAVVTGVASASLYGMSSARNQEFWNPQTSREELEGLRRQTNNLAYASLGTGVVAIGVGTAAVLTFVW